MFVQTIYSHVSVTTVAMVGQLIIPALLDKQHCTNRVADILKCIRISAEIKGREGGMKTRYETETRVCVWPRRGETTVLSVRHRTELLHSVSMKCF